MPGPGRGPDERSLPGDPAGGHGSARPAPDAGDQAAPVRLSAPAAVLRREGLAVNKKPSSGITREEELTVRRRGGRKWAMGTGRPIEIPLQANQRWSLDFVSAQITDGRRFRILTVERNVPLR